MKIFWSWQSDTPEEIGRYLIRDALADAVKKLKREVAVVEPSEREQIAALHVDQDSRGKRGSFDLARVILDKIRDSDFVVADVTTVGIVDPDVKATQESGKPKRFINSNVALELGYAYHALDNADLFLVMNTHYGVHEDLPFDLRHKGGTIAFELPPDATDIQIKEARSRLAEAFVRQLKGGVAVKLEEKRIAAETGTSIVGLVALGPDLICEGDILEVEQTEWKLHLRGFVTGDVGTLIRYVEEFEKSDINDHYVLLDALGDGRKLSGAPSLTKNGDTFIVRCPVMASFPRINAQAMPSEMAISKETNDLYLERGNIARVSGVAAIPQRIRSALSHIRGESPVHLNYGSRLQQYYWQFRGDRRLAAIFKLEVIRHAAIPYADPTGEREHTPFQCVERVQSVAILADAPVDGRLPLSLELDIKGLGRVEQKVSVIMPSAEKVDELSKKGASMGLAISPRTIARSSPALKRDAKLERNRKRLSVVTKRWEPAGLELEIRYQPEALHIGLSARITLLVPQDGQLKPGIPVVNPAPTMRGYVRYELGGPFMNNDGSISNVGIIKLNQDLRAFKTTVVGIMYVVPSERATEPMKLAKVRIEIVTDADEVLASDELAVSPLR